jgi:glycosyltransferase involved in cell wall biosynthesis
MADAIVRLLEDKETLASMRAAAIARASDYTPDGIIRDVLSHLGL